MTDPQGSTAHFMNNMTEITRKLSDDHIGNLWAAKIVSPKVDIGTHAYSLVHIFPNYAAIRRLIL